MMRSSPRRTAASATLHHAGRPSPSYPELLILKTHEVVIRFSTTQPTTVLFLDYGKIPTLIIHMRMTTAKRVTRVFIL
jgi:hypothetical protein